MGKKILLSVLMLSLIGCNQKAETKAAVLKVAASKASTGISLEPFNDFPEEIEGAGCYFAANKKDFKKEQYIYADNLENLCFIKVKGKFIRLELAEKTVDTTGTQFLEKFKNNEYELSVDFRQTGDDGDEAGIFEGSMTLKHNNESEIKKDLYGICGC
ncbi:hypothetical protein [Flavobacterium wongokense]|uniref:hypothetical protein n=1 Tax=Flavobacterium wongokense TaxID=2910674 RepID=UPI001F1CAC10|nr:hypothetical protein [Flavobacterium sp. WG47]MCF6131606.1 hypothetical protein [Flavobacterium sp. WG47]